MFSKFGRVKRNHILSQYGRNFLQAPWAGGIVLIVCVVVAMLLFCDHDRYDLVVVKIN